MSTVEVNPSTGNFDLVGGALTPWTSNIDAAGFNLTDVGQLGIGTASPRGIVDAYSPVTVGNVINGYVSQDNGAYNYPDDGYSYIFHVYAYKTVGAGRVYSATPYVMTFTDSSTFSVSYRLIINFDFVAGADGYRVVVINDDYYGAYGDYYFDTNTIPNYDNGGDIYSFESPMVTTPTSLGPDWYIDSTSGDITHVGAYSLSGGITQSDGTTQNSFSSPLKVVTGTYVTGTDAIFMIQGTGGISTKFRMLGQNPTLSFLNNNSGLPANTGKYQIYVRGDNGTMNWGLLNDAESSETIFWQFNRSGTTPSSIVGRGKVGFSNASMITPSVTLHLIETTEQFRVGYSTSQYYSTTVSSTAGVTFDAVGTSPKFKFADDVDLSTKNLITDTTTGTKIGTGTTQKLGFFNATPVVQQGATTELGTTLSNLGLRASGTAYPITTSGAVTLGSLTSGRIPIVGTAGLLGDDADLTFATDTLTATKVSTGTLISTGVVRLKSYTVATLPAGTQGDTAYVTDGLAPTFLATIVGGGAIVTPVFYNGTNWVAH